MTHKPTDPEWTHKPTDADKAQKGDPERCRCRECPGTCPRFTDRPGTPCPECRSGKHYGR